MMIYITSIYLCACPYTIEVNALRWWQHDLLEGKEDKNLVAQNHRLESKPIKKSRRQ